MEKVYKFLFDDLQFKAGDTVVTGISGGPDSMVLLHLLIELRTKVDIKIVCAHVNHNLRTESEEEKEFIEKYCSKNNIVFEYMKIEEYSDDNFHNQARTIRYKYFETIVKKHNSNFLLTAHHGDDLMETILMRIVRGSTLRGYSGFSKSIENNGYKIIRPLIFITKDRILKYAKDNNIEYRNDKSNLKDTYTRNRYRKYVLPFLKQEDPHVNEKFLKFSETLINYNNYIDSIMLKSFNEVFNDGVLDLQKFKALDEIIQNKTINYIFELLYDDDLMLISDVHTKLIMEMINSEKPNLRLYLPNNLQASKSYNFLKISEALVQEDYKIELNGLTNLPNGRNIEIANYSELDDNYICRLNKVDIILPLFIRNRRNGDKIQLKGIGGTKKIKDIFIDEKIAYEDRNIWPILVDSNDNIIWIPGLKKSKFNQPKDKNCDIILKYY